MKFSLILLLTLGSAAQARMQFMSCKTTSEKYPRLVQGNVDRDRREFGTLRIEQRNKDGKSMQQDYLQSRDLTFTGDQFLSEWQHDFTLTLPATDAELGHMTVSSQSGITGDDDVKCTFTDNDEEKLRSRELCYAHPSQCAAHGKFPKADEFQAFEQAALKSEKENPIIAYRRLLECKGKNKEGVLFTITGSQSFHTKAEAGLIDVRMLYGPFFVTASLPSELQYRLYKAKTLTTNYDKKQKAIEIVSEKEGEFQFIYNEGVARGKVLAQAVGLTKNFEGPLTCTEKSVSRDALAAHDHCVQEFLGCDRFQNLHGGAMPGPRDLYELHALQQKARSEYLRTRK